MYEMLVVCAPFGYFHNDDKTEKRGGGGEEEEDRDARLDYRITHHEVDYPEDMSPDAVSILSELLMKDPKERMDQSTPSGTIPSLEGLTGKL